MKLINYVMIDGYLPVLFSGPMNHSDIRTLLDNTGNMNLAGSEITSAGNLMITDGQVETFGESFSLGGMAPHTRDAKILSDFLKSSPVGEPTRTEGVRQETT